MKGIKNFTKVLLKTLILMFFINGAIYSFSGYGFTISNNTGESMMPTMSDRSISIVYNYPGLVNNLNRSDIVIWEDPTSGVTYGKRIIAFPNETIELKDGKTYINGIEYDEKYIIKDYRYVHYILNDSDYFVMGDNRANSNDSRWFGPVKSNGFIGKVLFTFSFHK